MRQIRFQCENHTAAINRRAEHFGRAFPGSHWFFEGCISLLEAAIALLTTLTRYPWKEKVDEAVELVDRAMAVFTHIVSEETGKRGEIARMAAEVLGALQKGSLWKSQENSTSAYHPTVTLPTAPVASVTKLFDVGFDPQWYLGDLHSSIFQSSPQYNLSGIRDIVGGTGFTLDPSNRVAGGRDIHMADLLQVVS